MKTRHLQLVGNAPPRAVRERSWKIGSDELLLGVIALKVLEDKFPDRMHLTDEQRAEMVEFLFQSGAYVTHENIEYRHHDAEGCGSSNWYDMAGSITRPRPCDVVIAIPSTFAPIKPG